MADVKNTQAIFAALVESRATRRAKAARKVESKKMMKESSDTAMFTGRLLRESIEDDVIEDVIDNIVVVTDPDKSVEDLEDRADDIQDAIEGSPEGEAAFSDEYVGDKVYACPICGESFFADEEYVEGDMCPVCKAEPTDGFLLQGVVSAVEPEVEEKPSEEEVIEEPEVEEPVEGEEIPAEEEEVELADDDEEEVAEESYNKEAAKDVVVEGNLNFDIKKAKANILDAMTKRRPSNAAEYEKMIEGISVYELKKAGEKSKVDFDNIRSAYPSQIGIIVVDSADNQAEIPCKVVKKLATECEEPKVEIEIEVNVPTEEPEVEEVPCVPGVTFDEESFNNCLSEFAEENYDGCLDGLDVEEVTYVPAEDVLRVECKATTKSGAEVPVTLKMKEEECDGDTAKLTAVESTNVFKIESKKPAFEFQVKKVDGAIKCESMKYSYVTTHSKAGKVKVEGYARAHKNNK